MNVPSRWWHRFVIRPRNVRFVDEDGNVYPVPPNRLTYQKHGPDGLRVWTARMPAGVDFTRGFKLKVDVMPPRTMIITEAFFGEDSITI